MDVDDTPSPKRRRTSSRGSSFSSRNSSPRPRDGSAVPNNPPNHILPLRRASLSRQRGGEIETERRYSTSRSRENSLDRDRLSDEAEYRDHGAKRRRRSQSDSSFHSAHSRTRSQTASTTSHASHSRSPSPAHSFHESLKVKKLHFAPLFNLSKAHARGITSVKFSPDGTLLATGSADATIRIYSVPPNPSSTPVTLLKTLRGHLAGINALAWSPLPPYTLASASDDKSILLWSPGSSATPISPSPLTGHHNYVYSLAFSPKGNMLVTGSYDEAVFLWDIRSARVMRSLPAHSDPVGGVDFLRDGTMVCSCAGDGLIRLWDAGTGQCLRTLVDEDRPPVTSVRFTPNGNFVLAWTLDSCIRLWQYVDGSCVKTYQGHVNQKYSLAGTVGEYMGGTEAFLVSGSEDGDVVAWDVSTKEILWRGRLHQAAVLSVDFTRAEDGSGLLVSAGLDRDVRVWVEVEEGDERAEVNERVLDDQMEAVSSKQVDGEREDGDEEAEEEEHDAEELGKENDEIIDTGTHSMPDDTDADVQHGMDESEG